MKPRYPVLLAIALVLVTIAIFTVANPTQAVSVDGDASYKGDLCYQIITDRFYEGDSQRALRHYPAI